MLYNYFKSTRQFTVGFRKYPYLGFHAFQVCEQ
jgi:hypothetical protein